jgi:MoxR-like ATPase
MAFTPALPPSRHRAGGHPPRPPGGGRDLPRRQDQGLHPQHRLRHARARVQYKLDIKDYIRYGASPRATLALTRAARAHAFLQGRGYVTPQDVKSVAPDVLRHRLIVSYEAEAEDLTSDDLVTRILNTLPVP